MPADGQGAAPHVPGRAPLSRATSLDGSGDMLSGGEVVAGATDLMAQVRAHVYVSCSYSFTIGSLNRARGALCVRPPPLDRPSPRSPSPPPVAA
eukprot:1063992-Prymnesium_polylepis.4